jgi:hypothetical protein
VQSLESPKLRFQSSVKVHMLEDMTNASVFSVTKGSATDENYHQSKGTELSILFYVLLCKGF